MTQILRAVHGERPLVSLFQIITSEPAELDVFKGVREWLKAHGFQYVAHSLEPELSLAKQLFSNASNASMKPTAMIARCTLMLYDDEILHALEYTDNACSLSCTRYRTGLCC